MLSPKALEIVGQLLEGRVISSRDVDVGPLDDTGKSVLNVLADNHDELKAASGEERAKQFCTLALQEITDSSETPDEPEIVEQEDDSQDGEVIAAQPAPEPADDIPSDEAAAAAQPAPEPVAVAAPAPDRWRLIRVTATNYRGLAPWDFTVEFDFSGRSTLIYGPNGSGKSSLLGAVVWVFTGIAPVDSDETDSDLPVYEPTEGITAGPSLGTWPRHCTLPPEDFSAVTPSCDVTIVLSREDAPDSELWVRRSDTDGLSVSDDGKTWEARETATEIGISSLDLQLSLIAPSLFGQQTLDQAKESKEILRLLLGLEDLAMLGKLAGDISRNCTARRNRLSGLAETAMTEVRNAVSGLAEQLPDPSDQRSVLQGLLETALRTIDIKNADETLSSILDDTLSDIATAVGLDIAEGEDPPPNIDEALISVLDYLESGSEKVFENFYALDPTSLLGAGTPQEFETLIEELAGKLDDFISAAKTQLGQRLEWWHREHQEDAERLNLKLHAAQLFKPEDAECPVCDQSVKDLPIAEELAELKPLSDKLAEKVDNFVGGLKTELSEAVPDAVAGYAMGGPGDRIKADWDGIAAKLGETFVGTKQQFESQVEIIVAKLPVPEDVTEVALLPEGTEPEFLNHIQPLADEIRVLRQGLGLMRWWVANGATTLSLLQALLTNAEEEGQATSLFSIFARGKNAARAYNDLNRVVKELRELFKKAQGAEGNLANVAFIEGLQECLGDIKKLEAFTEAEVIRVLGDISEKTSEIWAAMYSTNPTGLEPGGLIQQRTGLEATLKTDHYRVPIRFVANAGLQRAVALAFYFALLEQHPAGLGFIILDDVINSLDELHREKWAANVLAPAIDVWQVILASHQREFFDNHRRHFPDEGTFKLNRRTSERPISILPGTELARAEKQLGEDWEAAGNILRQFVEYALGTFDSYNAEPSFYDPRNLPKSIQRLRELPESSGLKPQVRASFCNVLEEENTLKIIQLESHLYGKHGVTQPMVQECLSRLREFNKHFVGEVRRLEHERRPVRQAYGVSAPAIAPAFTEIPDAANWNDPIDLTRIGHAAAGPEEIAIESSEQQIQVQLSAGSAVLVVADVLEPLARRGQWVLLEPVGEPLRDGDLVAVALHDGRTLLRRLWEVDDEWRLEGINPNAPKSVEVVEKGNTSARRVVGILFEPRVAVPDGIDEALNEWIANDLDIPAALATYYSITVQNDSLEPIARPGQMVLVSEPEDPHDLKMSQGSLGVIEVREGTGHVIKRVFKEGDILLLVSPNPIQAYAPITKGVDEVKNVWPVRGLIFDFEESN